MLDWLLSTDGFVSKSECSPGFTPLMLWQYGVQNSISGSIYQIFPILVILFLIPRHLRAVKPSLWALVLFVSTCGLTHFARIPTIWWGTYRLSIAVDWLNVLTSSAGLTWLIIALRRIKYIPIRSDLEGELESLREAMKAIHARANKIAVESGTEAAIAKLRTAAEQLKSLIKT